MLLKSGGHLVIDQTEAMTTIDVNTGAFVGRKNLEDTLFKTNLEAAQTIARQLRLRNLGGMIIIDFIDMAEPEHRRQVLRALERARARPHQGLYDRDVAARTGGTHAQTHARIARTRAVPALPHVPGARRGQNRANRVL